MGSDRVTIDDVRRAGFCLWGTRRVCADHGVDLRRLVREGIPMAAAEAILDANVQRVVAVAKQRISGGSQ